MAGCVGYPWFGAMSDERLGARYAKMKAAYHDRIEMELLALRTLYPPGVIPAHAIDNPHPTTPHPLLIVPSEYDYRVKCDNQADWWLSKSKENQSRIAFFD